MTKKIIFFGTPQFAVPTLQRLLASDRLQVVGVVTQPDKRRGRGNQLMPSPVKMVAMEQGLPVFQPQRIKKDREVLEQLQSLHADYFVVVAYGQILSKEILAMPRLGCVNVHGSLLPEYRGAAPIQWCLYHGKTETGITTMLMDEGMDTGAMLLKATVPIGLLDDAESLGSQLAEVGADLLVETIQQWLTVGIIPTPQNHDQATYAPLIRKSDYNLDWRRSAWDLHNQIRAFTPDCVAQFRDQPIKILATAPLGPAYWSALPPELAAIAQQWPQITEAITPTTAPGCIVSVVKAIGPIVQTGDGLLLLRSVQLPGKRVQSGWDFANGLRLQPGECLEHG